MLKFLHAIPVVATTGRLRLPLVKVLMVMVVGGGGGEKEGGKRCTLDPTQPYAPSDSISEASSVESSGSGVVSGSFMSCSMGIESLDRA